MGFGVDSMSITGFGRIRSGDNTTLYLNRVLCEAALAGVYLTPKVFRNSRNLG
jgi:hypothetical protein